MADCYFCGSRDDIERHHVIPRRFGGPDREDNLVDVCHDCHMKLERLYDNDVWTAAGMSQGDHPPDWSDYDDVVDVDGWVRGIDCVNCGRGGPFEALTLQPTGVNGMRCCRCDTVHV